MEESVERMAGLGARGTRWRNGVREKRAWNGVLEGYGRLILYEEDLNRSTNHQVLGCVTHFGFPPPIVR